MRLGDYNVLDFIVLSLYVRPAVQSAARVVLTMDGEPGTEASALLS